MTHLRSSIFNRSTYFCVLEASEVLGIPYVHINQHIVNLSALFAASWMLNICRLQFILSFNLTSTCIKTPYN